MPAETVKLNDTAGNLVEVTRREIIRMLQDDTVTLFGLDVHSMLAFRTVMNLRNMPLNRREAEDIIQEFSP